MFGLSRRQLFILVVFVLLLFAAAQYVPGYFAAFQFDDFIRQEVKYAATARKSTETIRGEVFAKAGELGIPVNKNDIVISRRGPSFTLYVEYHWPINMRLYKHDLVFHATE